MPLPRPLPQWGGHPLPTPYPPRRLQRLDPRAYGARNSRLRRSVPPAFLVSPPDLGVLAETLCCTHRRRSDWTSGGTHGERRRWARAEWGWVWGGMSPLQPTRGYYAPSARSGAEPRPKTDFGVFWRPQHAHFCTYMQNLGGGAICISVPHSKFWGTCPPLSSRDLRDNVIAIRCQTHAMSDVIVTNDENFNGRQQPDATQIHLQTDNKQAN